MRWETKCLGDVCDVNTGFAFKSAEFVASGIPLIRISNISGNEIIPDNEVTLPLNYADDYSKFLVKENDILIALSGATTGKYGIYRSDKKVLLNQRIGLLRPKNNGVLGPYLFHYLNILQNKVFTSAQGAAQPNISTNEIARFKIPLPPIPIQQRIGKILDNAALLCKKDSQLLKYYDDLAQSLFVDIFGDPVLNSSWKTYKIEQLAKSSKGSMRTGPFGSDLLHSEFVNKGIFVLGIDNVVNNSFEWAKNRFITEEKYEKLKRYTVYPGDVLISIMGTTGKCAIVPNNISKAINSKHLAAISPNQELVLPEFLCFSIHSDPAVIKQLQMRNKGAIMDGLNLGVIKQIELKLPPLKQQMLFSNILKNIEEQKLMLKQQMKESKNLYQTLLQKAFNDELN